MEATTVAYIAVAFSGITMFVMIGEKIFGGGNKLAGAFHKLETRTTEQINAVRNEFYLRTDEMSANYRVGVEAIKANIHELQIGLLEFRAKMAEDYMRRDSYHKATDEIKRDFKDANAEIKADMKDGFDRVEKTLGNLEQSIEAARRNGNNKNARTPA